MDKDMWQRYQYKTWSMCVGGLQNNVVCLLLQLVRCHSDWMGTRSMSSLQCCINAQTLSNPEKTLSGSFASYGPNSIGKH